MANQTFSVNTDAVIAYTAKLERINKSAFPIAVRATLNDGAFAMKKTNILASAKTNMHIRNQAFFRKFTGVERATGYKINEMSSQVGFINTDADPIKGIKAIHGMEENEIGGIDNTGAMYMKKARTGNSANKLVRKGARFNKSNLASLSSSKIKNNGFMKSALASLEQKKPVFIKTSNGSFLVQVKSISSLIKGKRKGKLDIKLDFLMRGRRQHEAHIKATHFNRQAALSTAKEMEGFYVKNAEYQFERELKRTI